MLYSCPSHKLVRRLTGAGTSIPSGTAFRERGISYRRASGEAPAPLLHRQLYTSCSGCHLYTTWCLSQITRLQAYESPFLAVQGARLCGCMFCASPSTRRPMLRKELLSTDIKYDVVCRTLHCRKSSNPLVARLSSVQITSMSVVQSKWGDHLRNVRLSS